MKGILASQKNPKDTIDNFIIAIYNKYEVLKKISRFHEGGKTMNWNDLVLDLMKKKRMNQKQLSKLSGISESSISRYLKSNKNPRMDVVVNIAKALQVETEYFFKEEDKGQTAFNVISAAIARKGGELTAEEKNKLIALLIGGNENV